MSAAERAYRLLLRAYPAAFRAAYGHEMTQLFNDRRRDASSARGQFWAAMLADVARSAPTMRLEQLRAQWSDNSYMGERTMKTMAILAILIGTLEVVSSAAEAWVGGLVLHGGYSLAVGSVAAAAGGLLVASAIAMLRGAKGAVSLAQGSAIACIAVFALVAALHPIFSILSTMLGIGFPIALLLYLRLTQGRGPSEAIAA
jgi:hypothetical protein